MSKKTKRTESMKTLTASMLLVSVLTKLLAGLLAFALGLALLAWKGPEIARWMRGLAQEAGMSKQERALHDEGLYTPGEDIIIDGTVVDKNDLGAVDQAQRDFLGSLGYRDVRAERQAHQEEFDHMKEFVDEQQSMMGFDPGF